MAPSVQNGPPSFPPLGRLLSKLLWKQSYPLYGNCMDHVLGWWRHRDAPNILFLTYEDMKRQPYKSVERITKFTGVEPTRDLLERVLEKTSFQNMKTDETANHRWLYTITRRQRDRDSLFTSAHAHCNCSYDINAATVQGRPL